MAERHEFYFSKILEKEIQQKARIDKRQGTSDDFFVTNIKRAKVSESDRIDLIFH